MVQVASSALLVIHTVPVAGIPQAKRILFLADRSILVDQTKCR
jgi:hypothetical protein